MSRHGVFVVCAATAITVTTTACTATIADSGDTPDRIVLADAQALGAYNPVNGFGELGVSQLYDGLLAPAPESDRSLPRLVPALAAAVPVSNADATVWEVPLRVGVTFSDGSAFGAEDVVATYAAVLDPASASEIAESYAMISSVTDRGDGTVRFELAYPYYAFPARLLLGIAPSEALTGGLAADSPLNREPIGTGPYRLTSLTPEQAVFTANADYWGGQPAVAELVSIYAPDDNARAQAMAAGGINGTVLPPVLAATFGSRAGMSLTAVQSADWRGVSMPAGNPFTNDEAARIAMNLGVDRQMMVDDVLVGAGRTAHTPVAAVYGDDYNAEATFAFDPAAAGTALDNAGWRMQADGVRAKDGVRAQFPLLYNATETVRRDLATAFAANMAEIGVQVDVAGSSWDEMDMRFADSAIMLGGGDKPYDLDTQIYGALHSRGANTATYDNPSGYANPAIDTALDAARRSLDPAERKGYYRQIQDEYIARPTYVFLAFLDHTYVTVDNGYDTGPLILEPHAHGVSWGPWWNIAGWGSP